VNLWEKFVQKLSCLAAAWAVLCSVALGAFGAEGLKLSDKTTLTWEQVRALEAALPRLPEDKVFFHWTTAEQGERWKKQGHLDAGEVKFYNNPTGEKQAYGPGVYLAASTHSSKDFGDYPVAFTIKKGTPVFDHDIAINYLGNALDNEELSVLGEAIPFVRQVGGQDWWLTNHPANTQKVEYAGRYGAVWKKFTDAAGDGSLAGSYKALAKLKTQGVSDPYLESLLALTRYQDGLSLHRSVTVNPKNPWAEFDPEHFENYKATLMGLYAKPPEGIERAGVEKAQWVRQQVDDILPGLARSASGERAITFRAGTVRAGGDYAGQKFYATPAQLENLKKNPYLQNVRAKAADNQMGYLVSYEYPTVSNFRCLKEKLSPQLFAKLERLTPTQLSDPKVTGPLNQRLLKELLTDLFSRHYDKPMTPERFNREFISIHPFADFNGRTSRLYLDASAAAHNAGAMDMMWSDFDLLLDLEFQEPLNRVSSTYPYRTRIALIAELQSARYDAQVPQYLRGSIWKELPQSLRAFQVPDSVLTHPAYLELIRKRDITRLLDETRPFWDIITPSALDAYQRACEDPGLAHCKKMLAAKLDDILSYVLTCQPYWNRSLADLEALGRVLGRLPIQKRSELLMKVESALYSMIRERGTGVNPFSRAEAQKIQEVMAVFDHQTYVGFLKKFALSESAEMSRVIHEQILALSPVEMRAAVSGIVKTYNPKSGDYVAVAMSSLWEKTIESGVLPPSDPIYAEVVGAVLAQPETAISPRAFAALDRLPKEKQDFLVVQSIRNMEVLPPGMQSRLAQVDPALAKGAVRGMLRGSSSQKLSALYDYFITEKRLKPSDPEFDYVFSSIAEAWNATSRDDGLKHLIKRAVPASRELAPERGRRA